VPSPPPCPADHIGSWNEIIAGCGAIWHLSASTAESIMSLGWNYFSHDFWRKSPTNNIAFCLTTSVFQCQMQWTSWR
jgi:hypothetical protein